LRRVLAHLLGLEPSDLHFEAGPHGKPGLTGRAAGSGLHFNLSHSADRGLIGWAWERQIGVDIERWRALHDEAALVRRFFSPAEVAAYEGLPPATRPVGFFHCWTRKEAYVKAVGRGLGLPLDSFDVSVDPAEPARLLRPSAAHDDGRRWALGAVALQEGWSGAVVVEGEGCHIQPAESRPLLPACEATHAPA
jgi:4'-phosphopantetheinyl transferase